jgi:hypothetical protein
MLALLGLVGDGWIAEEQAARRRVATPGLPG